jgi:hypothetical protein
MTTSAALELTASDFDRLDQAGREEWTSRKKR